MAEYYAMLSKAVAGLEAGGVEARRAVYDKARNALIGQLKAIDPPLPAAEISRHRLELEEAIRQVEREAVDRAPGAGAGRPAPPGPRTEAFRGAIAEAASRGAGEAPRYDSASTDGRPRSNGGQRAAGRGERPPPSAVPPAPPAYPAASAYTPPRTEREATAGPRLAPDYDWEPQEAPSPRHQEDAYAERRERAGATQRGRRRQGGAEIPDVVERRARPSRLPAILLLALIVVMAVGLAAFGWSQRAMLADVLGSFDFSSQQASAPPTTSAPASSTTATASNATNEVAATSNKNADRLPSGGSSQAMAPAGETAAPAGQSDVNVAPRVVTAAEPATQPAAQAGAAGAQKATLYEEPLNSGQAASGVIAIDATVTWRYVADSPDGAEVIANVVVPQRKMTVKLTFRRNTDPTLPASHLVEVVIDTPPDFPGKGIKSVPRLVLKASEAAAQGQPLIGATASITDGFFWIALSGVDADKAANLTALKNNDWLDLPLVYDTGQRAILTIAKGPPGTQAMDEALTAWAQ